MYFAKQASNVVKTAVPCWDLLWSHSHSWPVTWLWCHILELQGGVRSEWVATVFRSSKSNVCGDVKSAQKWPVENNFELKCQLWTIVFFNLRLYIHSVCLWSIRWINTSKTLSALPENHIFFYKGLIYCRIAKLACVHFSKLFLIKSELSISGYKTQGLTRFRYDLLSFDVTHRR